MPSSYKRLGDYIKEIKDKNVNLEVHELLGINIDKFFMPSVANTVGTDMTNYKVVRKNQFACNRMHVGRDYRLPIALSDKENPFLVSPAYDVFEVGNTDLLIPEYLMLWFKRSEFDRNAWFYTDADVRGGLSWSALLDMKLPFPSIEKQRAIVKKYNIIEQRINLNNQITQKLKDTAQAIYKHWFVDFEFPNEDGNPYKSSGGKMVYNEELEKEIPEGWRTGVLGDLCELIDGDRGSNYPKLEDFKTNGYCLFLNAGNVTKKGFDFTNCVFINKEKESFLRNGKLRRKDIVLTSRGTVGNVAYYSDSIPYRCIRINSGMLILRSLEIKWTEFLYSLLNSPDFGKKIDNYISGSAVPQLPIKDLKNIDLLLPNKDLMISFSTLISFLYVQNDILINSNLSLDKFKNLLLSRLAKES